MKRSNMFIKTLREAPADEVAKNAQLLIRAGYINKEMAGVYAYLPLGRVTLENIKQIIREEMNAIGGEEVAMTTLQPREIWEKTDRWHSEKMDVWFKTELSSGGEVGLAPTHEEPMTAMMKNYISSYKDLPAYPYQFQTKFRNELRAKSGLMRGREFLMKDLYSFSTNEQQHNEFYERVTAAYFKVYQRLGLGDITFKTFASGGIFSKYSHEFQTLSPVGEDTIYLDKKTGIAVNKEVYTDEVLANLGLKRDDLVEERAVEVGNIFTLGTKYSEPLGLNYTDEKGETRTVFMGSYGIGPSRLMGLIAEHFADDNGLVWPENIAPARVYLINIGDDAAVMKTTNELYEKLNSAGITVIWDDRAARPGEKFADAELMGIPHRVVVSSKLVADNLIEYKARMLDTAENMSIEALFAKLGVK